MLPVEPWTDALQEPRGRGRLGEPEAVHRTDAAL